MSTKNSTNMMFKYVIQVDKFSDKDINQLVKIHRSEIKFGFLTSLGDNALVLMFSLAAESKHSLLLTVKDVVKDEQVGFLLGTFDTSAFYKDFLKNKFFSAIVVLLPKLFSFSTVRKLIEVLLYPSKKDVRSFPKTELLDIAISSQYQGLGLAKQLFEEFSYQLSKVGVFQFKITTGLQLSGARRFYEALGAVKSAIIEVHRGQKTLVYVYKIKE